MLRALPETKHREERLKEVRLGTQCGHRSVILLELPGSLWILLEDREEEEEPAWIFVLL